MIMLSTMSISQQQWHLIQQSQPMIRHFTLQGNRFPNQMVILLVTVVSISGLLSALLIYHARKTRVKLESRSFFHILFAIFIGVGFMILEVTFIQKFLLLLGTPIMA